MSDWIAADWGTTRLRVWRMSGGVAVAEASSDDGMGALGPGEFEPALDRLTGGWGASPVIACGMVGARQGWVEAPYRPVPCPPLGGALATAPARRLVHIVPGLSQADPPDVMRGEETQIAGLLAAEPGFDGVAILPGTHTKWVRVSAGEVVAFRTYMTGELFALLAERSVLRHGLGPGWNDAAFADAAAEGLARPEQTAHRLFALRAEGLLRGLDPDAARARLSGLLIGQELAGARGFWLGQRLAIVGDDALARAYAAALAAEGTAPALHPAGGLALAGLAAARAHLDG